MIVEDNPINAELLKNYLELAGVRNTLIYSNPLAMIDDLNTINFNLVIMDIQLNEMSGVEAAEIILQNKKFSSVPIIAISGFAFQDEIKETLKTGFFKDYITKPIDRKKFIDIIRRNLL